MKYHWQPSLLFWERKLVQVRVWLGKQRHCTGMLCSVWTAVHSWKWVVLWSSKTHCEMSENAMTDYPLNLIHRSSHRLRDTEMETPDKMLARAAAATSPGERINSVINVPQRDPRPFLRAIWILALFPVSNIPSSQHTALVYVVTLLTSLSSYFFLPHCIPLLCLL